jgi:hypothetical protein
MNKNEKEKLLTVNEKDFDSLEDISPFSKNKISESNLKYVLPDSTQRDEILLKIVKYLFSKDVSYAGTHRKMQWEDGWEENLNEYIKSGDLESIVPKYFDKYSIQRLNGELIIPRSERFEIGLVRIFQYIIFEKYFKNSKNIYEFGAGTGHNLLRVREINQHASLFSMEWAKSGVEIINTVANNLKDENLLGICFNNFIPDYNVKLQPNSSVYTFAALEQLGTNTDNLINYWITNKASIVVNIEPMAEPLDENELLQYLSIKYFEKRGYLKDYINKLKILEQDGKIIIHDITRTGIGSLFIEGYSIIVWSTVEGN